MDAVDRTHGLWRATASSGPADPPLCARLEADVVIVGAGFTGCSAALHVAAAGRRPVVLEAAEIGFGASGRNVGLVNAGLWVMPDQLPAILGRTFGERLLRQLGEAPDLVFGLIQEHGIVCEAKREGTLHCAVGKRGLAEITERARQWQLRGADVSILDAAETVRSVGSNAYAGALLDRRAGTIQPLAYVRGLAHAAIAAGAVFHSRSGVIGFENLGTRWRVHTPHGSVTAPAVIIATDAYSSEAFSGIARGQVKLPYFNFATAPLPIGLRESILPGGQGAWDTKRILSSFRLDDSGRLIFGSVGALRRLGARIHREWSRRELHRLFPQLDEIQFEYEWYGMIGMTHDALPRLHRYGQNVYSMGAYNGRGIGPGTTFGRDLARLVTDEVAIEDLALPVTPLSPVSLQTAKSAFYEAGAQIAHFAGARM